MDKILIRGARTHNLANVDLDQKVADRTAELDAARRAAHRAIKKDVAPMPEIVLREE